MKNPLHLIAALVGAFCVASVGAETVHHEFVAGCLYADSGDEGEPQAVPLESSIVIVDIAPGVVETTVAQVFVNRTDRVLECIYLFPLPEDATITDMELRYADRVVKSVVQEKARARATYDAAKAAGKKAALLESARPNLFSNSVANFLPGESVEVRFSYLQELRYQKGRYSYRFPLVAGARYFPERRSATPENLAEAAIHVGSQVLDTLHSQLRAARAVASGVHYSFAIDIRAEGLPIKSIESPSHPSLRAQTPKRSPDAWRVEIGGEDLRRDRDLVIEIELEESASLLPTLIASQSPTGNYGLLTLFPPSQANRTRRSLATGRDVIFLLDHSGSMGDQRMKSAREGVVHCLESLGERDRFNIAIFDDEYEFYSERFVPATPEALARGAEYAQRVKSDGGTEMQPALRECLARFEASSGNERVIVFLTDGDVGNERELITLLRERLGPARLFTFGIGNAPNEFLIKQMAVAGRGQARFIMDDRAVAREIDELFQTLASPALEDVELRFLDAAGQPMDVDYLPRPIANVYADNPVQVVFRNEGAPPAGVELSGAVEGVRKAWQIALPQSATGATSLEPLFGRRWIDSLFLDYYAAGSVEETEALRKEIVEVSELMQLVTEFTSRVAVEESAPAATSASAKTVRIASSGVRSLLPIGSSGGGDEEVFELSPFTVDGSEDSGYRATSTLAGTRIRTSLKDVASSISVVTEQFLRDTAATSADDLLIYASGTEVAGQRGNFEKPRAASIGSSGLGGEGESMIVDPMAISRIDYPATPASAVSSVLDPLGERVAFNKSPRYGNEVEIGARWSDGGYRSAWLDGNRALVDDEWSVRVIASRSERTLRRDRLLLASRAELSPFARIDGEFAFLDYGSLVDGKRAAAAVSFQDEDASQMFQYEFVWSQHRNKEPFAFGIERLGTAALDELASDDLLFLAQTEAQEDRIHSITAFAQFDGRALRHSVNATARRRDANRSMRFAYAGGTDFEYASEDFETIVTYQAMGNEGIASAQANVATSSFALPDSGGGATDLAWDAGFSWRLNRFATLHGRYAESEQTPRIVTRGLVYLADTDSWALALPLDSAESRGWDARMQLSDSSDRFVLSIGYYRRSDEGRVARDWLSEALLREAYQSLPDAPAIDVALVNYEPFAQEGLSIELAAHPTYAWTFQMSGFVDWEDAGPVSGGNNRLSLITRCLLWEGAFDSLSVGGGARYRNEMRYLDDFRLMGGWSGDLFVTYEFGYDGTTTVQFNARSLGGEASRVSRYDADASVETMLTLSRRF